MSKKITLNNDQVGLIRDLVDFWNDDSRKYYVLSGQAGVGKTTCMRYFKEMVKKLNPSVKICMAAPTNKAVSVLMDSVGDPSLTYKTIYSILGLRMMANGEFKELTDSGQDKIGSFDLVLCDEGSMINTSLIDYLMKKTALADTKVVLIGDKEQLPPVGEEVSPIWTRFPIEYELTEVMRHQNSILDFVQSIRANPDPVFESPGEQVFMDDEDTFMEQLIKHAKEGSFHEGRAKAVAWRNVTVDFLNQVIRDNNASTKSDDKFVVGDRVVFKEPLIVGERTLASTDEEGIVVGVNVVNHNKYMMLKAWSVDVQLNWSNEVVKTYMIHASSERHLQKMLDDFKEKKLWKQFWALKEAFHNISYAYALTSHRSQGSTFEHVFVDAGDIMLNRNVDERTKCMYVACSRASKELRVFP